MLLPSILGPPSSLATSCTWANTPSNISRPSSVWVISRPLNKTETLTFSPRSIKRRMLRTLKTRSWGSVREPTFTSLTVTKACLLREPWSFFFCV